MSVDQESSNERATAFEPITYAPIDTDFWFYRTGADDAGNSPAFYVDGEYNFYSLIRPVNDHRRLRPNEVSTARVAPDMRLGGAHLRQEDGVFEAAQSFEFLDLQCRFSRPCTLICTHGVSGRVQTTSFYEVDAEGRVGDSGWQFSPPHSNEGQCQSRLLALVAVMYEDDESLHDGDSCCDGK